MIPDDKVEGSNFTDQLCFSKILLASFQETAAWKELSNGLGSVAQLFEELFESWGAFSEGAQCDVQHAHIYGVIYKADGSVLSWVPQKAVLDICWQVEKIVMIDDDRW